MKFHLRWAATALIIVASGVSSVSNAALVDRGGGLIYDTDLNITWLANGNANGLMDWWQANDWASGLTVDGVSGWRLPITDAPPALAITVPAARWVICFTTNWAVPQASRS